MKVPGDALNTLQKTPWGGVAPYGVAGPCTPHCAQTLSVSIEVLLPNHSSGASLAVLEDMAMLLITLTARNKPTHTRAEGGTPAAPLRMQKLKQPLSKRARTTLGHSSCSPRPQPYSRGGPMQSSNATSAAAAGSGGPQEKAAWHRRVSSPMLRASGRRGALTLDWLQRRSQRSHPQHRPAQLLSLLCPSRVALQERRRDNLPRGSRQFAPKPLLGIEIIVLKGSPRADAPSHRWLHATVLASSKL